MKQIVKIVKAEPINMGGIHIDQPLPVQGVDQLDPFLLIHHWKDTFTGGKRQNEIGVGPHPHRGFIPVTIVYEGTLRHQDSRGNDSIVAAPGAQWMQAGMGIVHSERPGIELAEKGGELEIIQCWINVPHKHKMDEPKYISVHKKDMPMLHGRNGDLTGYIVAGAVNDVKGSIQGLSPVSVTQWFSEGADEIDLKIPVGFHGAFYALEGDFTINNHNLESKHLAIIGEEGDKITLFSKSKSKGLLLLGQPLKETVAQYGPFVMGNQTEIMQAMRDYQMGKMGVLVEAF